MKSVLKTFSVAMGLFLALVAAPAMAQGGLVVTPKRIVLSDRDRTATVTLLNQGASEASYRIGFINQTMGDDGSIIRLNDETYTEGVEPTDEDKAHYADPLLRYSPRSVTLAPGQSQAIRILVRKPADLPEGEYRSHLFMQTVPPESDTNDLEALVREEGSIGIQITPVFGISIPVIIRHGASSYAARLGDATLAETDGQRFVEIRLHREGDLSLYGNLAVRRRGATARDDDIGRINGVGVYTSTDSRLVRIPLREGVSPDLAMSDLVVEFEEMATPDVDVISSLATN